MGRMHNFDLQDTLPSVVAPDLLPAGSSAGVSTERRAGKDRRRAEAGPPDGKRERRVALEARKPQVVELEMSASDWAAFSDAPLPTDPNPGR